ncbi:response regulator [Hydrogenophilus thermoluteolus]|nr:response regulator [Hydrogenophilus thermoluteolus]MBW7656649.1 response regulator [Hydrogenophilus thermoluteolus]
MNTLQRPLRILLIDDHALFRSGIKALLQRQNDFEVVGEAANGLDAVKRAIALQPDIILLDLNMPGMSGKAVLNALQEEAVRAKVIVLTVSENAEDLADVMAAGAQGYLLKNIDASHFIDALRRVASGETIISPEMTVRLVSAMRAKETPPSNTPSDALLARLTPREREILAALAVGASNKEIARQFDLSESTVKVHVQNILRKLECQSRVQAAVIAVEAGLGRQ